MTTAQQRVLIVDDDSRLLALLTEYLGSHGFAVSTASSCAEADLQLAAQSVDVVILDVQMPMEDGFNYVQRLRRDRKAPVLMLSGRCQSKDRVLGLELGADDYLCKPFDPAELRARLHALLRRERSLEPSIRLGIHRFDLRSLELTRDGQPMPLSAAERALLKALAENAGRTLSREQLLSLLGDAHGERLDRSIDVRVARLRSKIESDPAAPRYLHTVRGQGYRLSPDA